MCASSESKKAGVTGRLRQALALGTLLLGWWARELQEHSSLDLLPALELGTRAPPCLFAGMMEICTGVIILTHYTPLTFPLPFRQSLPPHLFFFQWFGLNPNLGERGPELQEFNVSQLSLKCT